MQTDSSIAPTAALTGLASSALVIVGIAATFTILAFKAYRPGQPRRVIQLWLLSASATAVVGTVMKALNISAFRPLALNDVLTLIALNLVIYLWCLGAIAWRVHRKLSHDSEAPLKAVDVVKGVLTFFLAFLILVLPALIWDASKLF